MLSRSSISFSTFLQKLALFFFHRFIKGPLVHTYRGMGFINSCNKILHPRLFLKSLAIKTYLQSKLFRIPRERGYAIIEDFPGKYLDPAIQTARSIIAKTDLDTIQKPGGKPYLLSIPIDYNRQDHEAITRLALSREIIAPVAEYLGTVPVLFNCSIWISPNKMFSEGQGSQNFHFDHEDTRQIKCFIFIEDVTENDGPFCFLDAQASRIMYKNIKQKAVGENFNKKFTDSQIEKLVPHYQDQCVKATGPSKTLAYVDTSRCLHYGSRPRSSFARARHLIMLHYLSPFCRHFRHSRHYRAGKLAHEPDFSTKLNEEERRLTRFLLNIA